jgi:hypothetical protein
MRERISGKSQVDCEDVKAGRCIPLRYWYVCRVSMCVCRRKQRVNECLSTWLVLLIDTDYACLLSYRISVVSLTHALSMLTYTTIYG